MHKDKIEFFEEKVCKEIDLLKSKYMQNPSQEMSIQDLEKLDKMYHLLKSMATYGAMKDAEEYGENNQNVSETSGYRGRGMDGRFVSRKSGNDVGHNSYAEGYSDGYSEAMDRMGNNVGNSGRYPTMSYPPTRW